MSAAGSPVRPGPDDTVEVDVQVSPRASRSRVLGRHGDRLKVQLAAPPADGAANRALLDVIARALDVPARDVDLVRGGASRRKTLRVRGLPLEGVRARLGLAGLLALLGAATAACSPSEIQVPLRVLFPADRTDLARTDNVAVQVTPDGPSVSQAVSGLDFAVSLDLDADAPPQDVSVYLAEGETLLAWGRTVRLALASATTLSVFVGPPGRLATFPNAPAPASPRTLAARARGQGLVLLDPDGVTWFLSEVDHTPLPGARLSDPGEETADATLVGDALGGVVLARWDEDPTLRRFDPVDDAWIDLPAAGLELLAGRAGAAHLAGDLGQTLYVFGGGARTDAVAIPLVPDERDLTIEPLVDVALDGPRAGARALWLRPDDTPPDEALLFGTEAPNLPVLRLARAGEVGGPSGPWTGGSCVQLDRVGAEVGAPPDPLRILCAGGERSGAPTADALLVRVPAGGGALTVEDLPGWLPAAMPRPLWLADEGAVYAHGGGLLAAVSRSLGADGDPGPTPPPQNVQDDLARAAGGVSVTLATGATFVLAGETATGEAVPSWHVFTPDLSAP